MTPCGLLLCVEGMLRRLADGSCRCNSIKPAISSRCSGDSGSCTHRHKTHTEHTVALWACFVKMAVVGWTLQLGAPASVKLHRQTESPAYDNTAVP